MPKTQKHVSQTVIPFPAGNDLCGFALFMCGNAHPHTFLRNFAPYQIPYSMPALGKILIIDDNEDVLFALHLLLEPYAEKVKVMRSPDRIVHFITDFRPDIVLLDMNFTRDTVSGQEGMDCLQEILKLDRHAVVVPLPSNHLILLFLPAYVSLFSNMPSRFDWILHFQPDD